MSEPHRSRGRRSFIKLAAGAAAAIAAPRLGWAQAPAVTVFGHRVHQTAATTGPGGDATEAWRRASGGSVNWVTLGDVNAIHERLLREASLSQTSFDLGYLLNGRAIPRNLRLFEPLNARQAARPIEAFDDFAPGLIEPFRLEGELYGVPVRHATNALIYNEALFEERGVALPKTMEDVFEAARKLTFRRDDGVQVHGLAFTTVFAANFLAFARGFGGDYMTADRRVVAAEEPMVRTLSALADLYKAGALPRNMAALNNEEVTTWMQQGRAAMTINPFARLVTYNDPQRSRYPGRIKAMVPPMSAALAGKTPYATPVEFWSLAIPRAAANKDQAWELIRTLSSKAGTLAMALNGNGPARISTYADARLKELLPYAATEAEAIRGARIHLPAFDEQARAHDIFVEETQAALLGTKPAAQAMADATRRVQPLI